MTSDSQPSIRTHNRLLDAGWKFDDFNARYILEAPDDPGVTIILERQGQGGYDLIVMAGRQVGHAVPIEILPPRGDLEAYGRNPDGTERAAPPPPMLGLAAPTASISTTAGATSKRVRVNLKQTAKGEWQADTTAEITYDDATTDEAAGAWIEVMNAAIGDVAGAEINRRMFSPGDNLK